MRKLYKDRLSNTDALFIKLDNSDNFYDRGNPPEMELVQEVEVKKFLWFKYVKTVRKPFWDYKGNFIPIS